MRVTVWCAIFVVFFSCLIMDRQYNFNFSPLTAERIRPIEGLDVTDCLSPDIVEGDRAKIVEECLQDMPTSYSLEDIPPLFPWLLWQEVNVSELPSESVPYLITSSAPLKGQTMIGRLPNGKETTYDSYRNFITYYSKEFNLRGWRWPADDQALDKRLKTFNSESPFVFVSKSWSYGLSKDNKARVVTFSFNKEESKFVVFISDIITIY